MNDYQAILEKVYKQTKKIKHNINNISINKYKITNEKTILYKKIIRNKYYSKKCILLDKVIYGIFNNNS